MKENEAVKRMMAGEKLVVCEYRGGKAKRVQYRDKESQKAMEFVGVSHAVEVGSQACEVAERVPSDFKETEWKQTIPKGTRCVLFFEAWAVKAGVEKVYGKLEPLVA